MNKNKNANILHQCDCGHLVPMEIVREGDEVFFYVAFHGTDGLDDGMAVTCSSSNMSI